MPGLQRPTVDQVSALIGEIYDAALAPAAWSDVLPRVAQFVGGHGASLAAKANDSERSSDIFFYFGLPNTAFATIYLERYSAIDPCTTAFLMAQPGQILSTCDAIDYDEFRTTRFYREWAEPQELVDGAAAILDKSEGAIAMAVVFRHARDGLVDAEDRARFALLVPHLQRAARIMRLVADKTDEAAALAQTLDGLRTAVFIVNSEGRICHANQSGRSMLREGDVVRAQHGRLATHQRATTEALSKLCAEAEAGRGVGIEGRSVPFTSQSGERKVAHVLPLSAGAKHRLGFDRAGAAAVFVQNGDAPFAPPAFQALAQTYALTVSELRVLLAIAERGGAADAAEALGIGEATVRTHLHRLFAKTGTSRQSDLVRLVARYMSPLVK
jgi:DNA-binding CsgD family transcriptional regulator/PAS domain-containing protein